MIRLNTFSESMNRTVLHKQIHKWIKGPAKRNEQYDNYRSPSLLSNKGQDFHFSLHRPLVLEGLVVTVHLH